MLISLQKEIIHVPYTILYNNHENKK